MPAAALENNLALASYFLPQPKRDAARAVFAFRRLIHEAIDVPKHAGDSVEARLDLFRDRLDEIYEDRLELPRPEFCDETQRTLTAFSLAVRQYDIPKRQVLDLADARRMDLMTTRYATWNALQTYYERAAGAIGRIMSAIVGVRHSGAADQLATLAVAVGFTRMLRDVADDAASGQIYLPLEDLARFGYSERQLFAGESTDRWRSLMRFEINRARQLYRGGADGICWIADDGARVAASVAAATCACTLDAIERQEYDVLTRPPTGGVGQMLARAPAIWRLARRREDEPLPAVFRADSNGGDA